MKCPFCEADAPELVSQFGSQLLFSQFRCRACGSYFEGLRQDRVEVELKKLKRNDDTDPQH